MAYFIDMDTPSEKYTRQACQVVRMIIQRCGDVRSLALICIVALCLAGSACSACAARVRRRAMPGELRVLVKDSQEAPIYDAKVRVGSDIR